MGPGRPWQAPDRPDLALCAHLDIRSNDSSGSRAPGSSTQNGSAPSRPGEPRAVCRSGRDRRSGRWSAPAPRIEVRRPRTLLQGGPSGMRVLGALPQSIPNVRKPPSQPNRRHHPCHGVEPTCRQTKPLAGPYTPDTLPKGAYDVIIVGAGQCAAGGGCRRYRRCRRPVPACCRWPPACPHPPALSPNQMYRSLWLRRCLLPGQGWRPRGPAGQGAEGKAASHLGAGMLECVPWHSCHSCSLFDSCTSAALWVHPCCCPSGHCTQACQRNSHQKLEAHAATAPPAACTRAGALPS